MAGDVQSQLRQNGPELAGHEAHQLDDLLAVLSTWSTGHGPLYRRLARAIRAAVERGDLPPGSTLPPERRLAPKLSVGRGTVVAAYELLRQEHVVERRQGSGTRVVATSSGRAPRQSTPGRGSPAPRSSPMLRPGPARPPGRNAIFRRLADGDDGTLDLVGAYVLGPSGLPPEALDGVAAELTGLADTPGYLPLGYAPLRRAIAEHLARGGLPTNPEQVLITAGAQQAIDLVARHLIRPGEAVVLEDPTYPGAIDILDSAGGRLVAAPTGRLGVDVNVLADLLAEYSPGLVYLIPTFHNPVGSVLPERSRRDLARLIETSGVTLVEDTSVSELALEDGREPPPAIAAYASADAPIIVIGSCSKLFWGGLRVGWVRAAEPVIAGLARFKAMCDLGGSLPSQVIAARLFEHIDAVRRHRRRELRQRLQLVEGLLKELLPDWTWEPPLGGACLWVRLPYGNATQLAQLALRHGVSIVPGPVASPRSAFADYLRLPFSLTPDVLEEGLHRLAQAWSAYRPGADTRRQSMSVIV
jgi:DNA-binding transcriptional MocR family regulator